MRPIAAVTFDCWNTLLVEHRRDAAWALRIGALREAAASARLELDDESAATLLRAAHARHVEQWRRCVSSGAREIARWALDDLGIRDAAIERELASRFENAGLALEVAAVPGAGAVLDALRAGGIRTALVCDTGFSSGRIVRQHLACAGLLPSLETLAFSDEVGVPKPDRRIFDAAIRSLGVMAADCVHVGDLKRTDVGGGRAAGMGTVRLCAVHDDLDEGPEADVLAGSYDEVRDAIEAARRRR